MPVRHAVTVNAPVDRVFAALTDLERFPHWNPNVLVEHLDGDPLNIGARHRHTSGPRVLETRIAFVDVPTRIVFDFDDRRSRGQFEYRLLPEGTGTRVEYERRYVRTRLTTRILSVLCPWWLGRGIRRAMQRLKSYAESAS